MTQTPDNTVQATPDAAPPNDKLTEVGTTSPQAGAAVTPTPADQFFGTPQTDASGATIPPADSAQPSPELTNTSTEPVDAAEGVAEDSMAAHTAQPDIQSLTDRVAKLEQWVTSFLGYVPND